MPWPYNVPDNITANVINVSTVLANADTRREYMLLQNISNTAIFVAFNTNAVVNTGINLSANGGAYEMGRLEGNLWQGFISAIHSNTGIKVICGLVGKM